MQEIKTLAQRAAAVKNRIALLGEPEKNRALAAIAGQLRKETSAILDANRKDLSAGHAAGLSEALLDRLQLDEERITGIAEAVEQLIRLPDPVGRVIAGETMTGGMQLINIRVPLGVCGIIYEARPNVTVDAATLCLKSGNVSILKGGREAMHSSRALMAIMRDALKQEGIPEDAMQLIENPSREAATALMGLQGELDVLIPRGGAGLIRSVVAHAKVPVIETGTGNNHLYVDRSADPAMAIKILRNAKAQRPSVCNAVETLLVHAEAAETFLPMAAVAMREERIALRACEASLPILAGARAASEADWETEYIDRILAVRIVGSLDEALAHIARYGTGHSEAIVTSDYAAARRFTREVDAAAVYVNASTRFTDGGEFGLGAEIGISTQKLHVRGPMGLEALTSNKYMILGEGQIRS